MDIHAPNQKRSIAKQRRNLMCFQAAINTFVIGQFSMHIQNSFHVGLVASICRLTENLIDRDEFVEIIRPTLDVDITLAQEKKCRIEMRV